MKILLTVILKKRSIFRSRLFVKKEQLEILNEIATKQEKATQTLLEYWELYSHMGTWQFWFIFILLLTLPLIVLYFTIDRRRIFLIGFYGFSINVWFTFADLIGTRLGWWEYPYMLIPFTPSFFSINSAVVPVVFMLFYQWSLNQNKNFYLYSLVASLIFSFGFNPLLVSLDFFRLNKGVNYFHLLLIYIGVFLLSKLITSVFLNMQKNQKENLLS